MGGVSPLRGRGRRHHGGVIMALGIHVSVPVAVTALTGEGLNAFFRAGSFLGNCRNVAVLMTERAHP